MHKFAFLWDKHLGVQVLGCTIILFLDFKETAKLLSRVAAPFYIPSSNCE